MCSENIIGMVKSIVGAADFPKEMEDLPIVKF
jgi:hypothetical protein